MFEERFCFVDIDECLSDPCSGQVQNVCENTEGSYMCKCPTGYEYSQNDDTCSGEILRIIEFLLGSIQEEFK